MKLYEIGMKLYENYTEIMLNCYKMILKLIWKE